MVSGFKVLGFVYGSWLLQDQHRPESAALTVLAPAPSSAQMREDNILAS